MKTTKLTLHVLAKRRRRKKMLLWQGEQLKRLHEDGNMRQSE